MVGLAPEEPAAAPGPARAPKPQTKKALSSATRRTQAKTYRQKNLNEVAALISVKGPLLESWTLSSKRVPVCLLRTVTCTNG